MDLQLKHPDSIVELRRNILVLVCGDIGGRDGICEERRIARRLSASS